MTSFPILDVAIGLSFFYLLLGLICTTVNEMIAGWRNTRSKFLDRGLTQLLGGDTKLKAQLLAHPLIQTLVKEDSKFGPSYIPSDKFATALLDILSGKDKSLADKDAVLAGANNDTLKGALKALADRSEMEVAAKVQDVTKNAAQAAQQFGATLQKNVAAWFDDSMGGVAGWYKRSVQNKTWILAAVVTLVLNADTLHVADVLWTSPTTRAAVVQAAAARAEKPPEQALPMVTYPDPKNAKASKPTPTNAEEALTADEKKILGELTGWAPDWRKLGGKTGGAWIAAFLALIWDHLLGWILTAIAVSMGAPFWFDVLKRFINIRNDSRKPGDQPKTEPAKS